MCIGTILYQKLFEIFYFKTVNNYYYFRININHINTQIFGNNLFE